MYTQGEREGGERRAAAEPGGRRRRAHGALQNPMLLHPTDGGGQSAAVWQWSVHRGPFAVYTWQMPLSQSSSTAQVSMNPSFVVVVAPPAPPAPPLPAPPPLDAVQVAPGTRPHDAHAPYASAAASHAANPRRPSSHVHARKSPA